MNYELNAQKNIQKLSTRQSIVSLLPFLSGETGILVYATVATLTNSVISLIAPLLIAHIIDTYIVKMQLHGVWVYLVILFSLYLIGFCTSYLQTRLMGGVGQRILYRLREKIFAKLQELPVAFFDANKTGDLISRINNDTDKLNQFFSQTLVQFVSSLVIMFGAAIFVLAIQFELGLASLVPAIAVIFITVFISPLIQKLTAESLKATGGLSAEVSESLNNFKVVVAFNRRDFFRERFKAANETNYNAAVKANIASTALAPLYSLASNAAQMIVLGYGIYLISTGRFSLGLLVGFLSYVNSMYTPLRQIASLWSNFQTAIAGWNRISAILKMNNDMEVLSPSLKHDEGKTSTGVLEFKNVSFHYETGKNVLHSVNFTLQPGKTYALVGPTGGGKTTTASLMARLYDPTEGTVYLDGVDIRTKTPKERTEEIGFILQEPILFSGTVKENILYGNEELQKNSTEELLRAIEDAGLTRLLSRFENGIDTPVSIIGDTLSLGQKQLIAFMRSILRAPKILILDEATANIDTVTEQMLEATLQKLPEAITLVIIAHRLNTIERADEIFFINDGEITKAGSMEHAVALLQQGKHSS